MEIIEFRVFFLYLSLVVSSEERIGIKLRRALEFERGSI